MMEKDGSTGNQNEISNSESSVVMPAESMDNTNYLARRLAAMGLSTDTQESEDGDMELVLCDMSEDSDSEYSYEYEDEERGTDEERKPSQSVRNSSTTQHQVQDFSDYNMDLVPFEDGEEEIDSEEERDLLKDIREEIQNKVKEEMKEEIKVYKAKIAAIEQGTIPGDEEIKEKKEEEENMDPKIKEALTKMRKLDRILMKKIKREKEVKRDRILLERRIREEIQNIKPEGREHKEVKCNTDKFVALALPPSHNEGVQVEPLPPSTPVFQTQLNEDDFQDMADKANRKTQAGEDTDTGLKSESSSTMGDTSTRNGQEGRKRKKKKKDFIKRNKELAANADEAIAMTEEERKRVGDLLNDLESLPELPEEMDGANEDDLNPFRMIPVTQGQGYCGDEAEVQSMAKIDGRLKELLPEDEFHALIVASPQESFREQGHKLFTHVNVRSIGEIERYGERALLESKEHREMQARLQRIEEQLAKFNNPDEIEIETARLSDDAMKGLIDQCVRSLSRTSYADNSSVNDATPRSEVSTVVSILENPPHLSDEVLQKLLAEAHFPLSSRLEALWEEDEKKEMEEEGNGEPGPRTEQIRAETWKVIAESEVCENGYSGDFDLESVSRTSSRSTLRSSRLVDRQFMDPDRQSINEYVDPERLVLPEISQSPFLVSQGMNNYVSKNETNIRRNRDNSRDSINMVRNNLSEVNGENQGAERDSDSMTPRPPSSDRRSNNDLCRSRNMTPLS